MSCAPVVIYEPTPVGVQTRELRCQLPSGHDGPHQVKTPDGDLVWVQR